MDHSQYMVNLSISDENWCSGHALMVTCPPRKFCAEHGMDLMYEPEKMMADLPKPDLARMLQLSKKLAKLSDQVTPVMAFAFILSHPRCPELRKDQFDRIREDLRPRVTCYG
jgi:hypothetical protein